MWRRFKAHTHPFCGCFVQGSIMLVLGLTLDYEAASKRAVMLFQHRRVSAHLAQQASVGSAGSAGAAGAAGSGLTEPLLQPVAENAAAEQAEQGEAGGGGAQAAAEGGKASPFDQGA